MAKGACMAGACIAGEGACVAKGDRQGRGDMCNEGACVMGGMCGQEACMMGGA